MKLGDFEIRRIPKEGELGTAGFRAFGGTLESEDYNPDLRGSQAIAIYDRMRKSDGQVKAALLVCELPLRDPAIWYMEPASKDPEDIEISKFVASNLFDGMTITWDDFLRHTISLMLAFGHSVFEKVWILDDGLWKLRKLAPRLPQSITEWKLDPEGGLESISQATWKDSKYVTITIPVEKLLVFTHEREGGNYMGISLLRAAYPHWYYKTQFAKVDAIAATRHGVGLPIFKLPKGAKPEDMAKAEEIGEGLQAHERSWVGLPHGFDFELKGVAGVLHDTVKSMEYQDIQIFRSVLAQFMQLGHRGGSYALSKDQSSFFLLALNALGSNICNTINRYCIPQLVNYNFDVKAYPKLKHKELEARDVEGWVRAAATAVESGLLLLDAGVRDRVRSVLSLPRPEINQDEKLASIREKQIEKCCELITSWVEKGETEKLDGMDVPFKKDYALLCSQTEAQLHAAQLKSQLVTAAYQLIEKKKFSKEALLDIVR